MEDGGTRQPQRLQPGDNVSAALHLWPALADPKQRAHRGDRDLIVRGSATAVGRRPTLSARRYAWRLPKDAVSRLNNYVPPREAFVYRALWRHSYDDHFGGIPLVLRREIVKRLEAGATEEDIRAYLDQHNKDGIHHMAAYDVYRAYHNAPTEPPQPRRSTFRRLLWGIDAND